jgi:hypothetical protein
MPGFLGGGSSGSSGAGGEIRFPKEFVDPVTKLRVSNPQNLIDTDFEYGLQPTKWETVELINNTPSFFSKSGDTTIPGILAITTNAGTREITVTTALDHGLAAGIPIAVTGTKSVTADGAYIINSVPNSKTFTYLSRDNEPTTSSIEDLYSSIITGEFFQGSQLRVADSSGVITDGEGLSTLTVKTESTHGFGIKTPFYFLNLNSTISQEFQSANTAAKSFDASNSATAQTFDGSNTLSSIPIDWSNSATIGGNTSTISTVSTTENTITVAHGAENYVGLPVGTPLYYKITTGVGFFAANPFGVVFLKTNNNLGAGSSTFQVSQVPDGSPISIEASLSGTFIIANQARTFAGNNVNELTQQTVSIIKEDALAFEGANDGGPEIEGVRVNGNPLCTVTSYSGSLINVSVAANAGLGYYTGAMLRYSTNGSAAAGLSNNTTYFVDSFFTTGANTFAFTVKAFPTDTSPVSVSGGTGTQTFTRIGVSLDKDIWHIKDSNYLKGDMLLYTHPENGAITTNTAKKYLFVNTVYDVHNYVLSDSYFTPTAATGGLITQTVTDGSTWNVHRFTTVGSSTFTVQTLGTDPVLEYLVVGGGGSGGSDMGGGGGAGGYRAGTLTLSSTGTYNVVVGAGGSGNNSGVGNRRGFEGAVSSFIGPSTNITALGGGGGASNHDRGTNPGGGLNNGQTVASGGGASGGGGNAQTNNAIDGTYGGSRRGTGTPGQGFEGGTGSGTWFPGSGGGSAGPGRSNPPTGGPGTYNDILGVGYYWAAGGGGSNYSAFQNNRGGLGGGGGGAHNNFSNGGTGGINPGLSGGGGNINTQANVPGGAAGANTGSGGGGGAHYSSNNFGGAGGSGIVVVRYRTSVRNPIAPTATGGTTSELTLGNDIYRVHQFTSVGSSTFTVSDAGNLGSFEYLVVGGGGGGGMDMGGGGGGGAVLTGIFLPTTGTSYPITVGAGGNGAPRAGTGPGTQGISNHQYPISATAGGSSSAFGVTALGGGFGASSYFQYTPNSGRGGNGASGGGASGYSDGNQGREGIGTSGQGFNGGGNRGQYWSGGGGGAGGPGGFGQFSGAPFGGPGSPSNILGVNYFWGGGGGGSGYSGTGGNGGNGGGGGGAVGSTTGGAGLNNGSPGGGGSTSTNANTPGGNAGANTGGGGGGGAHYNANNQGGNGGSGIVIVRYKIGTVED